MPSARIGETCPICGAVVERVDDGPGESTVCERGHRLVNPDSKLGKGGMQRIGPTQVERSETGGEVGDG